MDRAVVDELVGRVHGFTRACGSVDAVAVGEAVRRLQGWLDHILVEVAATVADAPVPGRAVDALTGCGEAQARRVLRRTETADAVPVFGEALAAGEIQGGHVDALTGGLGSLPAALRPALIAAADDLVAVAKVNGTDGFRRAVEDRVRRLEADGGEGRLERQKRAARCKAWTDKQTGMFRLSATLDPEAGIEVDAQLRAVLDARDAEAVPEGCPDDPVAKQDWLRARALVDLLCVGGGTARVDIVAVVDVRDACRRNDPANDDPTDDSPASPASHDEHDGHDGLGGAGPSSRFAPIDVGLPVEVPWSVLCRWYDDGATVSPVVLDGGVVLYAPGQMDLGRTSRLASRDQRRVLRVLHHNRCCIPGCSVRFDLAKIHHLKPWEEGGTTDLHNLVPLCQHHHDRVHHDGWTLTLNPDRTITLTTPGPPDGTGPPEAGP